MRHVCDACGMSYSRAANLNRHKAEVHNNDSERRRHMCSRCGRNFVSGGRLVNHVCREQVGPQPRILVRDRDYDDTTLDPHPQTHRSLTKYTPQTGPLSGQVVTTGTDIAGQHVAYRWYIDMGFWRLGLLQSSAPSNALRRKR